MQHTITKEYSIIKGWSTDSKYVRPSNVMEVGVNVMRLPDGTISPRRGYQCVASDIGGLGLFTYDSKNRGTEVLCINRDGNLYRLVEGSLNISFSGVNNADFISFEIIVDPTLTSDVMVGDFAPLDVIWLPDAVTDSIIINVYDKVGALILTQNFGKGFNVAFPYSVSDLITALNGLSGVTVTSTGNILKPAAFIPYVERMNIANGKNTTLEWRYWEPVNHTVTATFAGLAAEVANPNFQIASFAAYQEDIYINTRYDFPQKYDGQTVYRAGMPEGAVVTPTLTTTGAITATDLQYAITYEQLDATGRLVEGVLSDPSIAVSPSSQNVLVSIPTLVAGSGWNTDCAIIFGNQVNVNTIIVNFGHTLKVGDTAFFYDATGNEITREITAITANSFTIVGAAVDVLNNQVVSNNLKINLYRRTGTTGVFQLIATLPNNSIFTPMQYIDSTVTGSEGRNYIQDARPHNPPPKTAYVVPFQNILVMSGDPNNDDFVWFSEADNPEYVSTAFNFFLVPSNDDDVTGLGVAGSSVVVFKERSIYTVNGDIINNQFTVSPVASGTNIGCVSHHTIIPVGTLLYFLHTNGVYCCNETSLFPTDPFGNPIPISIPIDAFFREIPLAKNQQFQLRRAVACNYTQDNQYLLFLPSEDDPLYSSGVKYANRFSQTLCYDYQGKNWFQWTNWNAAGGFAILNENIMFQERRQPSSGDFLSNTYQQNRRYRDIDFVDHVTPIRVTIRFSWEDLNQPRVRKKFIRCVLLFDEVSQLLQTPNFTMAFRTYLDWLTTNPHTITNITTVTNGQPFNISLFSWNQFAGYKDTFVTVPLRQGTVSKALQISLQMKQLNANFKLQGYQLEIASDFNKTVVR